jgi:eukaryotic-like serine/threonine-protein kinase
MSIINKKLNERFYITKSLAEGGFARTYIAEDCSLNTKPRCVIKHLNPNKENLPYLRRIKNLFEKEAAILKKLGAYSTQIPTYIDYFEEKGELYLVQEWIDGTTLSEEFIHGQKFNQTQTIQLLIDILTPLVFCHQEKLIHRDLKPDNIMRRQRDRQLVIIDFGVAKDMNKSTGNSISYAGTPGYAAMEQQRGRPQLASDVYGVGIIGIEALTGMQPEKFEHDEETLEITWRHHTNVTNAFAEVLSRMVRQIPNSRYQDAQAALDALLSLKPFSPTILLDPLDPHQTYTFESITLNQQGQENERFQGTAKYLRIDLSDKITLHMVQIPFPNTPLYIGKYPITQEQYQIVMGNNPSCFKGNDRLPVECVSWYNTQEFCDQLSQQTGKKFRLPSQEEWQYACKAGTVTPFYCGDTISTDLANYNGNYRQENTSKGKYRERTTPVCSFPPNRFGLYDMHGNVWEWCEKDASENHRILKGGSWCDRANDLRSEKSLTLEVDRYGDAFGFRVLMTL